MLLEGKVAVITGGTSGIGAATVLGFVREGANVIFTGTNGAKGKSVVNKVGSLSLPGKAVFRQSDVSSLEHVESLASFVKERFGNCGVLFNNAGVHFAGSLLDTPSCEFDRAISVDLKGVYLACYYFIPQMLEVGQGCIINMSSVSGVAADFSMAAYNAAKGGVTNLTRSIAIDYGDKGIRTNAICPGAGRTEIPEYTFRKIPHAEKANRDAYLTPTFAEPEEIAEVEIFLASNKANFINGANILIDGGITAHTGHPRY